jgi:hypothetical protein
MKNERSIMTNKQMELELAGGPVCPRVVQRERRQSRARWWFDKMKRVVERATDWKPAPRFRPEQIWLPEPGKVERN